MKIAHEDISIKKYPSNNIWFIETEGYDKRFRAYHKTKRKSHGQINDPEPPLNAELIILPQIIKQIFI